MFAASIADINKALKTKTYTNLANKLLSWLSRYLLTFNYKAANTLLPLRDYNSGDHKIDLIKIDQKKKLKVLWELLYNILRNKLLVLWKTLNKLLDKEFICISSSSIIALVLFVKKPKRELWFYIDYRVLNSLIYKNRYSLLLI